MREHPGGDDVILVSIQLTVLLRVILCLCVGKNGQFTSHSTIIFL